ncbi:hypothetical protein ANANG_G00170190 [Anguilla anguilla]|uniref:Thrombospondin-like N-terminal domain-containing protein n=1 Tax=Anguilla anguilla TaxID=7936 RepID=A0A9D3RSZ2_ANGAN|nr:hypothetical protein ANANG_G00170190 [Anguilla anguilla]
MATITVGLPSPPAVTLYGQTVAPQVGRCWMNNLRRRVGVGERGSKGHLDLTELIGVPLPPSVSFVTGYEGFPAYSFGPDANIGRLTKTFAPDPFFRDFAIIVTARPTARGGVLFAVTDAFQRAVYLGLALSPTARRLYMDCEEYHSVPVRRSARRLRFEPGSGIFVGNAGATGLRKFEGSIQQLVIKPDPRAAEEQCEEDDPYASGDASGDDVPDDRETLDEVKKRVLDLVSSRLEDALSVPVKAPPTEVPYGGIRRVLGSHDPHQRATFGPAHSADRGDSAQERGGAGRGGANRKYILSFCTERREG